MIPNELRDMALSLSLKDKIQFCQDLLSDISRNTNAKLDRLAEREAEIKVALKFTKDEIVKTIFGEDE